MELSVLLRIWNESVTDTTLNISNIEFGHLEDVKEFDSLMGSSFTDNLTFVDITEYETLDATAVHERDYVEGESLNPKSLATLQGRANECEDMTGWSKIVCDNVPNRNWFWGAGAVLTFIYSPSAMAIFLDVSLNPQVWVLHI